MKQANKSPVTETTDHRTVSGVGPHLVGVWCPELSDSFWLAGPNPSKAEQVCLTLFGALVVQMLGDVRKREADAELGLDLFKV